MVLKRKRDDCESCPLTDASSSSSHCGSPVSFPSAIKLSTTPEVTPLHLHSRTQKRFRNGRPSDEEVHARTLGLLYSAQQHQQEHHAPDPGIEQMPQIEMSASSSGNQQSLHRFWNIPSAPAPATTSAPPIAQSLPVPSSCDDCGIELANDDSMDVDDSGASDHACGACGKHVCFSCSVSNLGEQRRCLRCAGRKVWVGGIGWAGVGMTVG